MTTVSPSVVLYWHLNIMMMLVPQFLAQTPSDKYYIEVDNCKMFSLWFDKKFSHIILRLTNLLRTWKKRMKSKVERKKNISKIPNFRLKISFNGSQKNLMSKSQFFAEEILNEENIYVYYFQWWHLPCPVFCKAGARAGVSIDKKCFLWHWINDPPVYLWIHKRSQSHKEKIVQWHLNHPILLIC